MWRREYPKGAGNLSFVIIVVVRLGFVLALLAIAFAFAVVLWLAVAKRI